MFDSFNADEDYHLSHEQNTQHAFHELERLDREDESLYLTGSGPFESGPYEEDIEALSKKNTVGLHVSATLFKGALLRPVPKDETSVHQTMNW